MGRKLEDFTGKICGCWKVIERDRNPSSRSHETFWKCECQRCGNLASVRKTDLKKEPRSCNNCKGDIISEKHGDNGIRSYKIGDRYGLLTIIGRESMQGHHTYVKCKCECGNIVSVRLEHLKGQCRTGRTISCGCSKISGGELKIKKLLEENNINFRYQYIIPEFSKYMAFDFAIMNGKNELIKLIEFDGEQHFYPVDFFGGEEQFNIQQERNKRKNDYCDEHNIPLLRIPYTDYDKIDIAMLLS